MPTPVLTLSMQQAGGTGKTPLIINWAAYLTGRGVTHTFFDCDMRSTSIRATFPHAVSLTVSEDFDSGDNQLGVLWDRVRAGENCVVDTGANTCGAMDALFERVDMEDKVKSGVVRLAIFCPVTLRKKDSLLLFTQMAQAYPWADLYLVHFPATRKLRPDQLANLPPHPTEKTITFPYLSTHLVLDLSNACMTLEQALERRLFKDALYADEVSAARRRLYAQFDQIFPNIFNAHEPKR